MNQYTLPELPYEYDALTPAISEKIMKLHHQTHHAGYVTKLNDALASEELAVDVSGGQEPALVALLGSLESLPESIRTAVRNNGGGHLNHSFFWKCMCPGGVAPSGELEAALTERYGSLEAFKQEFTQKALGLFGSGWVWLSPTLEITTCANQDSPVMNGEPMPILGLDVWEHAYYLDYGAARKDYVDAWWGVVDWGFVAENYRRV